MRATEARRAADAAGRRAEAIAALWLRLKGYTILARRQATPLGEIDIVAARGGWLVLVEVKARRSHDAARAALGGGALARVARAARLIAAQYADIAPQGVRIDAVLIVPRRLPYHIVSVWSGS